MTVSYERLICARFSSETLGGFCIRSSNRRPSLPKSIGVSLIGRAILLEVYYNNTKVQHFPYIRSLNIDKFEIYKHHLAYSGHPGGGLLIFLLTFAVYGTINPHHRRGLGYRGGRRAPVRLARLACHISRHRRPRGT